VPYLPASLLQIVLSYHDLLPQLQSLLLRYLETRGLCNDEIRKQIPFTSSSSKCLWLSPIVWWYSISIRDFAVCVSLIVPKRKGLHNVTLFGDGEEKLEKSLIWPKEARQFKPGEYIIIEDRPCQIVSLRTSQYGKLSRSRSHFDGIDVLTREARSLTLNSHLNGSAFNVDRNQYQVVSIQTSTIEVIDDSGSRFHFPIVKGNEVHDKLVTAFNRSLPNIIKLSVVSAPVGDGETLLHSVWEFWIVEAAALATTLAT